MINLEVNPPGTSSNAITGPPKNGFSSLSPQSFSALLSDALSKTLSKFGIDPNSVKLTVENQSSQGFAASQFFGAPATPATPVVPTSNGTRQPALPVGPGEIPGAKHWYGSNAADDAYWSQQPPAVQELREIDDPDMRKQLGEQLAASGYSIDVPIMVWGWDAGKVMQARQTYGYTWVPSALQSQVTAAPGVSGAGIVPYNPNKPPSGSIRV